MSEVEARFFKGLLFDSRDCVKILDSAARIVSINENGRAALCIRNIEDVVGVDWRTFWNEDHRSEAARVVDEARFGGIGHFVGRYDVEGRERWWDVTAVAMPDPGDEPRLLVISRDVTSEHRSVEFRLRERSELERRLRAVNAASDLLSSSLDFEVTLDSIAEIAVDAFSTICVVEVVDGRERRHAVLRARRGLTGPPLDALRDAIRDRPFTALSGRILGAKMARRGESSFVTSLASVPTAPEIASRLHDLGVSSLLAVPVVHDGVIGGVITLCLIDSDYWTDLKEFAPTDVLFAEEMGRRAGLALANARSYGRERAIAVRMQQSALPKILPRIDHLRLSAAYRPSGMESTIGGDWFDGFALRDGRVALTIGDVSGHGLDAALTMTKLRQAMRIAALSEPTVLNMLCVADEAIRMEEGDVYASAVAAIYDPSRHTLEVANAGHPGPLIRSPDGRITDLTASAPLLGLGIRYVEARTVPLGPGALVVFFTDGLIEYDRDVERGLERLRHAVARTSTADANDLADRLVAELVGDRATPDDVALLAGIIARPG